VPPAPNHICDFCSYQKPIVRRTFANICWHQNSANFAQLPDFDFFQSTVKKEHFTAIFIIFKPKNKIIAMWNPWNQILGVTAIVTCPLLSCFSGHFCLSFFFSQ
jgi:hypothetical protein